MTISNNEAILHAMKREELIQKLNSDWQVNPRWKGVKRPYTAEEVADLCGSVQIEHTVARLGAMRLWDKLNSQDWVAGLWTKMRTFPGSGW